VALVAALHVYFLILEMFLWTKPLGLKTFRNSLENATDSAVLAANQGLYNGFLAAGRDRRRRLRRGDREPQDAVRSAPAAIALILLWLA